MLGMVLAEILEQMGYNVCGIAATEDGAVADAARYKPGLMIVDEQLLEGSGTSAVERILRTGPVPCVFISGEHTNRPGATVLQKPFVEKDLARAIQAVIGTAEAPTMFAPAPGRVVPDR